MGNVSKIKYNKQEVDRYLNDLRLIGELSLLYSDSSVPFLHYRATENIYCSSFNADNISRADISADARLRSYGIGIKTFIESNKKTFQKVAEFNSQSELYKNLQPLEKVKKISELRNNRIDFTKNAYDIKNMIYHCVVRNKQGFNLFEEDMNNIDIEKIKLTEVKNHSFNFTDGIEEYMFNESKSTLYKRFITNSYFASIDVNILKDPISILRELRPESYICKMSEMLVLPLYSVNRQGNKEVPERSGLNQWNARGRQRHPDEVYIPYPAPIREQFENYFPDRNTPFDVLLPNGKTISMKVCQDGGKAIMSNPNKALGQWLLRDVLKLPQNTLLTYQKLLEIGIDAVVFEKIDGKYKLDFANIGTVEKFYDTNVFTDYE